MARVLLCCLVVLYSFLYPANGSKTNVKYITPGEVIQVLGQKNALGFDVKTLNIFCWNGQLKRMANYFETAHLRLAIDSEDYLQYQGPTPEAVLQDIENKKSLFSFNFLWSSNRDQVTLDVFNRTCIGVETKNEYQIVLQLIQYDTVKLTLLCLGTLLLFVSGRLSENSLFFYICGVSFGVCASFLILVYFVSRIFPRKALMYGTLVCGWTLVFYFGQMMWQNFQMLAIAYREYLMYYCVFTGLLSFIICYRYGPPTDKRSKSLIKWGLQGVALLAIWNSSDLKEASIVAFLLLLTLYYMPKFSLFGWVRWPRSKKRRFITVEQYEQQAAVETAKALEELKRFCSSPECNQWKTIRRLKDPSRFASFIEGDSHLVDSEIIDYETSELNLYSEDEAGHSEDNSDRSDFEASSGGVDRHLISEEDDYEEQPPRSAVRRQQMNGSAKNTTTWMSGQRRLITNSQFRAERTPPKRYVRASQSQRSRQFNLSDED